MRFDVKSEKKNPFMKRKEMILGIENPEEATPSKAVLQKDIASHLKADIESIEIIDIFQDKGIGRATARINVWDEKKVANLGKKEPAAEKTE